MPLVLADRVRETTTTTGTGTISLAGPVSGFQGFSTAIGNANTTYYTIVDAATGAWEVGLGTYASSGSTLARTTVLSSSNAGAAVNFAAGTKDVFVTQPSERAVYVLGAGTGLAAGAAAFTANGVPYASATNTLTTGSALTFDGTNLGVGSAVTALGTYRGAEFAGTTATTGGFLRMRTSDSSINSLDFTDSNGRAIFTTTNHPIRFGVNDTESMRLTTTGLGIGNSSPTAKLDVTGTAAISGAVTLSGGTANGVAFLNGSKVLTTGSALSYNGSTLGVSDGSVTAGNSAVVLTGRFSSGFPSPGAGYFQLQTNNSDGENGGLSVFTLAGGTLRASYRIVDESNAGGCFQAWNVAGSEQMRLTTTGLGIGTSSPVSKLTVLGAGTINAPETTTTGGSIQTASYGITTRTGNLELGATDSLAANIGGSLTFSARYSGTNATWVTGKVGAYRDTATSGVASSYLAFATTTGAGDLTERMRLDSSGNLGLGVTPSAWSGYKPLQAGSGASFGGYAGDVLSFMGSNAYNDNTNWRYILSGNAAARYQQSAGIHAWYNAPSGTAGNAISFTQAMTLDASGNLALGQTSASFRFDVLSGADVAIRARTANNNEVLRVESTGTSVSAIRFINTSANGTYISADAGALAFLTGTTERARITSGGYSKFSNDGNYTGVANTYHEFYQTANNTGLFIRSTNGSYTATVLECSGDRATTNTSYYLFDVYNGNVSGRFRVADSGNATNTNGSYGTISDAKMKTDIVDAGSQWADIKAIRFRKFKMKDDPAGLVQLGVVAQELEQTSPGLVEQHTDRDAEGNDLGTTTKSVKTSVLLMKAAVALQEAMARIEKLEAEVATLKGTQP